MFAPAKYIITSSDGGPGYGSGSKHSGGKQGGSGQGKGDGQFPSQSHLGAISHVHSSACPTQHAPSS